MQEIPLFPLPMVMFPGVLTPLHIFEERYRLLINRCIERGIEESPAFGIVLIGPGVSMESESAIRPVGVTVRIVQFERIENGRLNILVAGEKRFRIREFKGRDPYWAAEVEFLEDDESGEDLTESFESVRRLYRNLHELIAQVRGVAQEEIRIPDNPVALANMVSYVVDIDADAKQELLEMSSVSGRLKMLVIHLQEILQRLNAQILQARMRRKVSSNGDYGVPN